MWWLIGGAVVLVLYMVWCWYLLHLHFSHAIFIGQVRPIILIPSIPGTLLIWCVWQAYHRWDTMRELEKYRKRK
jgi:hypothetical protein